VMLPAVAVKVLDVPAAATITEAGTERLALLLVREMEAPPEGAALESVTVQVLMAPEPTVLGLQARDETVTGATKAIAAVCEELL
jgi:hypothetical protein